MLYDHLGPYRCDLVYFIHVFILKGDATIRPHFISVDRIFVMGPGTMDRDAVADLCSSRDEAFLFALVKFGQVRRRREIEVHYLIPFFVGSFRKDVESSFGRFPVALYHLVVQ